jgi:uncharacterized membrane protein YqiK
VIEYLIRHDFDLSNEEGMGDEAITGKTADSQPIQVEGSILLKIDKKRANELWENIGDSFVSKIVRPVARSRIRSVMSEISLEQLTAYRTQVEEKVKNELNGVYTKSGIVCDGFLLSEIKDLGDLKSGKDDKVLFSKKGKKKKKKKN